MGHTEFCRLYKINIQFQIGQNMDDNKSRSMVLLKSILYGSLTACASLPFEHPLDALKTNMQSNQASLRDTMRAMVNQKGYKAFYNGFSMNIVRVAIKQALRWPLWISFSSFYKEKLPHTTDFVRQPLIGFSISGCQLILMCPFERLKIWLMTTKRQEETSLRHYLRQGKGFGDLYVGFTPLLVRQWCSWASFLTSSEVFKGLFKEYRGLGQSEQVASTDLLLISIPVAIINTLFIMPIDCIKTFYQNYDRVAQKKGLPFFQFLLNSVQTYRLSGLYLGWQTRMIQYMIQSALTLILIEELHYKYNRASSESKS